MAWSAPVGRGERFEILDWPPERPGRGEDRPEPVAVPTPPPGVGGGRAGIDAPPSRQPTQSGGGTRESAGRAAGADTRAGARGTPGGTDNAATGGFGEAARGSTTSLAAGNGDGSALVARGGGGGGAGSEYGPYLTLWRTRIQETVRYPLAARRRSLTGTVQIEIVIEPNGAVGAVKVVESSSHDILDEAVLESVKRLPPLPFPPHLVPRAIRARLPVVFEMR
ncbi:MAG: energy transducer TonB [Candidatus Rokuibacteriota bacterium]